MPRHWGHCPGTMTRSPAVEIPRGVLKYPGCHAAKEKKSNSSKDATKEKKKKGCIHFHGGVVFNAVCIRRTSVPHADAPPRDRNASEVRAHNLQDRRANHHKQDEAHHHRTHTEPVVLLLALAGRRRPRLPHALVELLCPHPDGPRLSHSLWFFFQKTTKINQSITKRKKEKKQKRKTQKKKTKKNTITLTKKR